MVVFLIASLINILYSVIWIAGVQVIFAIAKNDRFHAFGGVFQQGILKGIVDILHLCIKSSKSEYCFTIVFNIQVAFITFISRFWWESRSIYNIALGTLSNYWSRYRTFNNDSCICFKCSQRAFPPIDCWTIESNRYGNDNHCSKHLICFQYNRPIS